MPQTWTDQVIYISVMVFNMLWWSFERACMTCGPPRAHGRGVTKVVYP